MGIKMYRQKGMLDVIRVAFKWDEAFNGYQFQLIVLGFGLTIGKLRDK